MARLSEPGTDSFRSQMGIRQDDPEIFRPTRLVEAIRVARMIQRDEQIDRAIRSFVVVGIVLELMPGHLTPRRQRLARALGISKPAVDAAEIAWEGVDPIARFELVARAQRCVFALRAAART